MPQAVSHIAAIFIGRVCYRGEFKSFTVIFDLFPTHHQQRPNNRYVGKAENRGDAGEPPGARPPQKLKENGFSLIASGVAYSDAIGTRFLRDLLQRFVSQSASRVLG